MPFTKLGLSGALLRAVADQGYTVPTPIQTQAIPAVLAGGDLLAGAQTGTGKTAGFVLPILQHLSTTPSPHATAARKPLRVLIVTPTRELAAQVEMSVRTYGKHLKVTSTAVFGGVGLGPQTSQLRRGVDILVATPGRLLDHQRQRNVDLSRVEILVLDEADRMLDMGFLPDIRRILALLPSERQTMMFSATMAPPILDLARAILRDPVKIIVGHQKPAAGIVHSVYPVAEDRKLALLSTLLRHEAMRSVLVFVKRKVDAERVARVIARAGIVAGRIHADRTQGERIAALESFRRG